MGLLDSLIYGIRDIFDSSGTQLPRRSRVKFTGTVTDDPANDRLVVTVGSSGGSSAGSANQIDTADGAGGWLAPSNVSAVANAVSVGANPALSGNGVRLGSDGAVQFRNAGHTQDVVGLSLDSSAAVYLGSTSTNQGNAIIDAPTASSVLLRNNGTAKLQVSTSSTQNANPRTGLSTAWGASEAESTVATTGTFSLSSAQYSCASIVFSGAAIATVTWPAPSAAQSYEKFVEETGGFAKTMTIGSGTTFSLTANARRKLKFTNNGVFDAGAASSSAASAGGSGQVQTSDGAGAFLAPSNVLAGANFVSVGASPASAGLFRLPSATAQIMVAGTQTVLGSDSSNVYLGTDSSFSNQAATVRVYGSTQVTMGLGAGNNIVFTSSGTSIQKAGTTAYFTDGVSNKFSLPIGGNSGALQIRTASVVFASSDITLSSSQSECPILTVTGSTGGLNIVAPTTAGAVYIVNCLSGGIGCNIKTSGGTAVTCNSNQTTTVYCDGTNYHKQAVA